MMTRPKILLAVGARARRYEISYARTRTVHVDDSEQARRFAGALRPSVVLIFPDEEVAAGAAVRAVREVAPFACVIVVGELSEWEARDSFGAGANYCAASWFAVTAQHLVGNHLADCRREVKRRATPCAGVATAPRRTRH